jgi:hypothetical protein
MERDEEDVLALRDAYERRSKQRCVLETEGVARLSFSCSRNGCLDVLALADIDACEGKRVLVAHELHQMVFLKQECGSERLVTRNDDRERLFERPGVELSLDIDAERDVVNGKAGV